MQKTYRGSCHCGAVKFEADLDLTQPSYRCNCSICRRNRFWPAVAKADGFRLLSGKQDLVEYLFNTRRNQHFFCRICGVRAFGVGNDTPIGKMYGVNIGCLEGVSEEELSKIPITYVDGMNDNSQGPPAFVSHLQYEMNLLSDRDREFRRDFDTGAIAPASFAHRSHLWLAALLDPKVMLTHYSREVLFSEGARASFIEADIDPIPVLAFRPEPGAR